MGKNFNPLARRIGIFYESREWAVDIGKQLSESIPEDAVEKVRKHNGIYDITLKDGSSITFVKADEGAKGHRFSEVFVQKDVDWRFYDHIIRYMMTIAPYSAIMVDKIEDFYGGISADEWYGLDHKDD